MKPTRRSRTLAVVVSGLLLVTACGDDDDGDAAAPEEEATEEATDGTEPAGSETEEPAEGGYAVDTSDCPDESVDEPIEDTVSIGTAIPLSGGAAVAFAPVAEGLEAYIQYANEEGLLPDHEIELNVEDDQYRPDLTTPAVESLLDEAGVNLFAGIVGTPNNLAVRDLLNEECYPQLLANSGASTFGDVENFPWTTGALPPYETEIDVYLTDIATEFPDGGTAALFTVNNEAGQVFADRFSSQVEDAGLELVDEQTIEAADSNPPTSQVTSISAETPDMIVAFPLGAQCPAFLSEIANAKASNPGWDPRIYITYTCATSPILLTLAGDSADGIVTVGVNKDTADPANFEDEAVAAYRDYMTGYGVAEDFDFVTGAAGWLTGEHVVTILAQAAESPDGLTRASILDAARNYEHTPSLAREGITTTMAGEDDPFLVESLQIIEYDAASKTYTEVGELVTDFEGQTEVAE